MARGPKVSLIITLINIPVYWSAAMLVSWAIPFGVSVWYFWFR